MANEPLAAPWTTPASPSITSSTARPSVTIVKVTSLCAATSAAEAPALAPAAIKGAIASCRRDHTRTAKPCFSRLLAIGTPMVPRPTNPSASVATSARLCLHAFLGPRALEDAGHRVVALVAGVFEDRNPVGLTAHRPRGGPFLRERLRIVDGEFVVEVVRVAQAVPLDQPERVPRSLKIGSRIEVGRLDDERIALPAA